MTSEPTDPFERIERATNRLARRVLWEQGNRIGLLRCHAWVGMIAGAQMLAFGGPSTLEMVIGYWVRMPLGVLGILGGVSLAVGVRSRPRRITMEATGLLLLGLWDLCMTLGLFYGRLHTTSFGLSWPWEHAPGPAEGYVTPYPIAVYAGLLALILIHLSTLRKLQKSGAPPAGTEKVKDIPHDS